MTDTVNLKLPTIDGGQAQKHATHNEALRILDALVMPAVLDRDLSTPPASPAEGARYIVKPTGTGSFAGHDNQIAHFADGGWTFYAPQTGWTVYVADEGKLLAWSGSAWAAAIDVLGAAAIQNLDLLGVGTTADSGNPLSAKLNNALFAARTVAEGGDGHLRLKLSKESAAKTASVLLQDNFSGRAEIGLAGDDDFHVKVSADGTNWQDALLVDRATGKLSFPGSGGPREVLTANRTYFVRTDGSDGNSGLSNTAGGAFLTVQKAVDTVAALDLSTFQATIQITDGTYTGAVSLKRYLGAKSPIIQGNAATPANVLISTTAADCFANDNGGLWTVKDMKLTTTTSGRCLYATNFGAVYFANVDFGTCAQFHLYSQANATIKATGSYAVSGGAQLHAAANGWIVLAAGITITYSNSPVFSTANFLAGRGGIVECFSLTFANGGTVTGQRYSVLDNGVIFTNAAGATYLPGNSAGTTATGGQYD